MIAVDPVGSIFHDYFHTGKIPEPGPYLVEGLGDETLIECVDWSVLDDVLQVTDRAAFLAARDLVATESILGGGSSGAASGACASWDDASRGPRASSPSFPMARGAT